MTTLNKTYRNALAIARHCAMLEARIFVTSKVEKTEDAERIVAHPAKADYTHMQEYRESFLKGRGLMDCTASELAAYRHALCEAVYDEVPAKWIADDEAALPVEAMVKPSEDDPEDKLVKAGLGHFRFNGTDLHMDWLGRSEGRSRSWILLSTDGLQRFASRMVAIKALKGEPVETTNNPNGNGAAAPEATDDPFGPSAPKKAAPKKAAPKKVGSWTAADDDLGESNESPTAGFLTTIQESELSKAIQATFSYIAADLPQDKPFTTDDMLEVVFDAGRINETLRQMGATDLLKFVKDNDYFKVVRPIDRALMGQNKTW